MRTPLIGYDSKNHYIKQDMVLLKSTYYYREIRDIAANLEIFKKNGRERSYMLNIQPA